MSKYLTEMRQKIGNEIVLMPTTACIIVNDKEEILLQHRSDTNNWGCPGGMMDVDETVVSSVTREVQEETGLVIKSPKLLGIYSGKKYRGRYPNGDKIAVAQMVFIVDTYEGKLVKDDESKELIFFPTNNMPKNRNSFHSEYLDDYIKFKSGTLEIPVLK